MVYDLFETGLIGVLTLVADEEGLRHIHFENDHAMVPMDSAWRQDPAFFTRVKGQLRAYFNGELKEFDLPLAPMGTVFQKSVWQALQKIPYGTVASYRWVAEQIGNPRAVRAVGGANGRNPLPIVIPCHRVIGSDGSLTGFGGGLEIKQRLIDLERPRALPGGADVPSSRILQPGRARGGGSIALRYQRPRRGGIHEVSERKA
jgi:methylated-DNA-[protein]-cysteine S-methyltransferase